MRKKIFNFITIFILSLVFVHQLDETKSVHAVSFDGGLGVKDNPYLISTPEQLAEIGNMANYGVYYKLTADLDLSGYDNWEPIHTFAGTLDGNGHTIKNITINRPSTDNVGLFSTISRSAGDTSQGVVKDLTISNASIIGRNNTGVLAGESSGAEFANITLEDIAVNGAAHTGGLVGYADSHQGLDNVFANNINVEGNAHTGGLFGYLNTGKQIKNISLSNAEIKNKGNHAYTGGLIGQGEGNKVIDVTIQDVVIQGYSYVGGIAGRYIDNTGLQNINLLNINITANANYSGGISGQFYNAQGTINNINSESLTINGKSYTGGLIGLVDKNNGVNNITSKNIDIIANSQGGGLFGKITSNGQIDSIFMEEIQITGQAYLGLLSGELYGTGNVTFDGYAKLSDIEVAGEITSTVDNVGGLIGVGLYNTLKNTNVEINITINHNDGGTSRVDYIGGIYGDLEYGILDNINSYGIINVTDKNNSYNINMHNIGGIAGDARYVEAYNVSNSSNIFVSPESSTSNIGGVFGSFQGQGDAISNNGSIKIQGTGAVVYVGGIIGNHSAFFNVSNDYAPSDGPFVTLENIINLGNIEININGTANAIGGLYGRSYGLRDSRNFVNYGDIFIESGSQTQIGGIMGIFLDNYYNSNNTHQRIENFGDIEITSKSGSTEKIGGIIGYWDSTSSVYQGSTAFKSYWDNKLLYVNQQGNIKIDSPSANRITHAGRLIGLSSYRSVWNEVQIQNAQAVGSLEYTRQHSIGNYQNPSGIAGDMRGVLYQVYSGVGVLSNGSYKLQDDYNYKVSQYVSHIELVYHSGVPGKPDHTTGNFTAPKSLASYEHLDKTQWINLDDYTYPYLKQTFDGIRLTTERVSELEGAAIDLTWEVLHPNIYRERTYELLVEKKNPTDMKWEVADTHTFTTSDTSYQYLIEFPVEANTKIRYKLRSKNEAGVFSPYTDRHVAELNNRSPEISVHFDTSASDFSVPIDKRLMDFSITNASDEDENNTIKFFADILEVENSKGEIGTEVTTPITSFTEQRFKLKFLPNLSGESFTYDILVVDANDESNVFATLIDDRPFQDADATEPETFTFRVFAVDYKNNTPLTPTEKVTYHTINFTVDTRNNLPTITDLVDDVNGRLLSFNEGYDNIKFSGKASDIDIADTVDIYYTVKEKDDHINGVYYTNPNIDVHVATLTPEENVGVQNQEFSAVFHLPDTLQTGEHVLVIYPVDSNGGIGAYHTVEFELDMTRPTIRFFAEYNGNTISTAQRQIITKNSILKMYFSAYNHNTLEYAGYLVKANNQYPSGDYIDLNIRGAFTNDVEANFIGVNLNDPMFEKGDMLVFKFRATSNIGESAEQDVRIYIGDQSASLNLLNDDKVPTPLHITPFP